MSAPEPAATPLRLTKLTIAQAVGTLAEVFVAGFVGLFFAAVGLGGAIGLGVPGAAAIERYLTTAPTFPAYVLAAGVVHSSHLIAVRTRIKAGLETALPIHRDTPDTRTERLVQELYRGTSVVSYTASILVLTAVFVHQVAMISPVIAMGVLVGYPYLEHRTLIATARRAETPAEATSPITPAILLAGVIAFAVMSVVAPLLVVFRLFGYIASIQAYIPSFDRLISNIRDSHEQVLFYELARLLPGSRRSS